jgi:hypothetical protein
VNLRTIEEEIVPGATVPELEIMLQELVLARIAVELEGVNRSW